MIVYRVEIPETQEGPYTGRPGTLPSTTDWKRHPMPESDGISWRSFYGMRNARFGFKSLTQYRDWFRKKEKTYLKKNGFKLSRYEIADRHVRFGKHQVVFNADKAVHKGATAIRV